MRSRHSYSGAGRLGLILLGSTLIVALSGCGGPSLSALSPSSRVLAFGDSLTFGTGATGREAYPAVLQELLGCTVINAGVPGETTAEAVKRLPDLLRLHQPSLLILCHGGNDFLRKRPRDDTIKNLSAMIRLARKKHVDVLLVGVPRPGLLLSSADFYRDISKEFNLVYEGEILGDVLSHRLLKSDRVHPNGKGYRQVAEAIARAIRKYERSR